MTLRDTHARIDGLGRDLRRLEAAYDEAWRTWASAGSPLRSPCYDRRRSGKPSSSTPPEAEGLTRMWLVICAQRLAMALRILARHDWLNADAWHPMSLQRTHVVMRDPWLEVPKVKPNGDPDWRDAADVTVEPVDIAPGVSQLRGIITALCDVDWERQDEADRDTVRDMLHEAEAAVGAVKATGAWPMSLPDPAPKVCVRCGWREVKGRRGEVCRACVQAGYRERQRAS